MFYSLMNLNAVECPIDFVLVFPKPLAVIVLVFHFPEKKRYLFLKTLYYTITMCEVTVAK